MAIDKKKLISDLKRRVSFDENHWEIVKNSTCLKEVFGYCKAYCTPQTYGALIQKKIIQLYHWEIIEVAKLKGDIRTKKNLIELKVSLGGKTNKKFNFVQLRLSHKIDFYLFIAYVINKKNYSILGELFIFKIPKDDMLPFLNSSFSHGTKKKWAKISNNIIFNYAEKSFRVTYGSKTWNKLLKYRINLEQLEDW